jgi:polysaccharide biosynthesis transport protein
VNGHLLGYLRVIRVRLWSVILVFLGVVISVGVATYLAPRQYKSFVTIEVQEDMTPIHMLEHQTEARAIDDPKFSQTQFQIISRKGVLYPVIDRLNLQAKWARDGKTLPTEAAYNKLRAMLNLEGIRNTNLIQINVYSPDPQEAALLANTIANVYMDQRIADEEAIYAKSLEQLRVELKRNEKAVSQAYADASRLRTEANIIDPNPDSLENSGRYGVEDSSVITNLEKVNEAKSQVAMLRSKVEQLDRVKSEDLMRAAAELNLNDPILQAKLPTYQTALVEKTKLLHSGLGPNHPDVKALGAQIETVEGQLRQQIDSLRKGLVTQLAIAENSLKALEANLQDSQIGQQAMKTVSAQYLNAKYKYIQERKLLELAKTRLSTESMERKMPQRAAFIRDLAEPALFASKPAVVTNMLLGIAAGIVLGVSLAFLAEYLDTSVKSMEDIAKFLDVPVLGVIPRGIKLLPKTSQDLPDAEAYRILRANADMGRKKAGATCMGVTSAGASEGKSTTVCNLATTWARGGRRVLIIDGDLRRPSQHRLFGMDNRMGLSNCLRDGVGLDEVILPTSVDNLYLMPAGLAPQGAADLLDSEAMEHLIDVAKQRFEVILVDSPPILGMSDAFILSSLVDCSIVVVQHRRLPRSMLMRVKDTIESTGGRFLGVVLNKVNVTYDQNYEYLTNYTHYYAGRKT